MLLSYDSADREISSWIQAALDESPYSLEIANNISHWDRIKINFVKQGKLYHTTAYHFMIMAFNYICGKLIQKAPIHMETRSVMQVQVITANKIFSEAAVRYKCNGISNLILNVLPQLIKGLPPLKAAQLALNSLEKEFKRPNLVPFVTYQQFQKALQQRYKNCKWCKNPQTFCRRHGKKKQGKQNDDSKPLG